jgi:hypothetical protein
MRFGPNTGHITRGRGGSNGRKSPKNALKARCAHELRGQDDRTRARHCHHRVRRGRISLIELKFRSYRMFENLANCQLFSLLVTFQSFGQWSHNLQESTGYLTPSLPDDSTQVHWWFSTLVGLKTTVFTRGMGGWQWQKSQHTNKTSDLKMKTAEIGKSGITNRSAVVVLVYIDLFNKSPHQKVHRLTTAKKQGVSVSNCQIARTTKHNVEKMETSRMVRSRAILNRLTWNLNRVDSMT